MEFGNWMVADPDKLGEAQALLGAQQPAPPAAGAAARGAGSPALVRQRSISLSKHMAAHAERCWSAQHRAGGNPSDLYSPYSANLSASAAQATASGSGIKEPSRRTKLQQFLAAQRRILGSGSHVIVREA